MTMARRASVCDVSGTSTLTHNSAGQSKEMDPNAGTISLRTRDTVARESKDNAESRLGAQACVRRRKV